MVKASSLVLVKVPEHHGELLESVLGDSALVPGLDLLLEVVTDPHAELVELVPLLGQPHRAVLGVTVVQDQLLLQDRSKVLDLAKVGGTSSYLVSLDENNLINFQTNNFRNFDVTLLWKLRSSLLVLV